MTTHARLAPEAGTLETTDIEDVLRRFELSGSTVLVNFETDVGSGDVAFENGVLIRATLGDASGSEALERLGRAKRGSYAVAAGSSERPAPGSGEDGPSTIGRYELLCRIGQGGMGVVYLCRLNAESGFRRLFALKLLREHLLRDLAAGQRFLDEARLAGHMHHPNVVGVIDAGLLGPRPYVVMDYVEGPSLRTLLGNRLRNRPLGAAISIVLDALLGLHATHTLVDDRGTKLDIVHGDVSPDNLLVGADGVCRLGDFGVARRAASRLGRQRTTFGKPAFLAPEHVMGGQVDARADIFAMGSVLFGVLTGLTLFEAPTAEESLLKVCRAPIPLPSSVGLRPPAAFDAICMRALERDPRRRYQTAQEMWTALREAALRLDLLASPPEVSAWVTATFGREIAKRRALAQEAPKLMGALRELLPAPKRAESAPPSDGSAPEAAIEPGSPRSPFFARGRTALDSSPPQLTEPLFESAPTASAPPPPPRAGGRAITPASGASKEAGHLRPPGAVRLASAPVKGRSRSRVRLRILIVAASALAVVVVLGASFWPTRVVQLLDLGIDEAPRVTETPPSPTLDPGTARSSVSIANPPEPRRP